MDCKTCGGKLTITHTEVTQTGAVKRTRKCNCDNHTTTYERPASDAFNEHELRLVERYKNLDKNQRLALWAFLRAI